MGYIKKNNRIPLDAIFLIDIGIAILFSPVAQYPMASVAGIPFFHQTPKKFLEGGIHIYNTDTILALFMTWTTAFRTSFFEDKHPLAFYIEKTVNDSLNQIDFLNMTAEETQDFINRAQKNSLFDLLFCQLNKKYGK